MLAPLYTSDEMKAAEAGHDVSVLMENAGRAVAEEAMRRFPRARTFTLYAGKGSNGGDGKIAARILEERGWREVSEGADLAIDALLGTGIHGAPRDEMERMALKDMTGLSYATAEELRFRRAIRGGRFSAAGPTRSRAARPR